MDCPCCGSIEYIKNNIAKNDNNTNANSVSRITRSKKSDKMSVESLPQALGIYLEGLDFRAIGRVLKVDILPSTVGSSKPGNRIARQKRACKSHKVLWNNCLCMHEMLLTALGCHRSIKETFCIICLRGPFDSDGLEVMGEIEGLVGLYICDGLLAEL